MNPSKTYSASSWPIAAVGVAAAQVPPVHADALPRRREKAPDADGFIQRWLLLEPIAANGLTDSAVQAAVKKEYFPNQFTVIPHDGDKVTVGDAQLTWHAVDTKQLQRQPLSLRARAGQADLQRPVLGRHRRQLPARRCAACAWPSAPTRLRSGG